MEKERKVLLLGTKDPWFSMIAAGEKKEVYRKMNSYWDAKLFANAWGGPDAFTHVLLYKTDGDYRPKIEKEIRQVRFGKPQKGWCPEDMLDRDVYIIELKD